MFEDSLLNGSHTIATRRATSTIVSLGIQTALLGALVALPLFTSEGLPFQGLLRPLVPVVAPPRGTEEPMQHSTPPTSNRATTIVPTDTVFRTPATIPTHVDMSAESDTARNGSVVGVPGGDPNGKPDGVLNSILAASAAPPPPVPTPTAPRRLLISHYDPGMVIRQVKPVYPHTALISRTEGAVVLRAIVGKDGTVQDLRVVSGSPLLVSSALDAVRQWQFKPYLLNGVAIEVETQVTVNFVLNR